MARVTVEDCLQNVDNRFQLVLVAAKRARQLTMGKEPMVDWENDKATVVALREISEGFIDRSILEKEPEVEKKEESLEDLLAAADSGIEGVTEQSAQAMSLAEQAESLFKSSDSAPTDTEAATNETLESAILESAPVGTTPVDTAVPAAVTLETAAPEAAVPEDDSAADVTKPEAGNEDPDQTL